MKNIVLYILVSMTGLLMLGTEATGQKTSIDLLPSVHKRSHPEENTNINVSNDSLVNTGTIDRPSSMYINDSDQQRISFRKSRRTGFQINSLFQKTDRNNNRTIISSGNSLVILKNFNPIKFIMHIIALKI